MKTSQIAVSFSPALGLALSLVWVTPCCAGFVVNVDFNSSTSATYSGTAVAPDTGTFWNPVDVPGSFVAFSTVTSGALTESDGSTSSPITVSVSNVNGIADAGPGSTVPASDLMEDYLYTRASSGDETFTLNNLPSGNYDLYLYAQNASSQSAVTQFTFGSDVKTAANAATNSFVINNNYVAFLGLTPVGNSISGTIHDATGTNDASALTGFQLVQHAPVPEPSSVLLLSLAAAALVASWCRRRSR